MQQVEQMYVPIQCNECSLACYGCAVGGHSPTTASAAAAAAATNAPEMDPTQLACDCCKLQTQQRPPVQQQQQQQQRE
jgi:hypothetical protein